MRLHIKRWWHVQALCLAFAAAMIASCGAESGAPSVETLHIPAGVQSAQSNIAVGPDGTAYASWLEPVQPDNGSGQPERHRLLYASLEPGGMAFSDPVEIASGSEWLENWADFPNIYVDRQGHMIANWMVSEGDAWHAYNIFWASSTNGRDWQEHGRLPEDRSPTEHGFVSYGDVGDEIISVWLDGRKYDEGVQEMTLRSRTLTAGGDAGEELLVDDLICECCQTGMTVTSDDRAIAVYRDLDEDNVRNIAYVTYQDGSWSEPATLHDDGWVLQGCPVNGPRIDAHGEHVAAAWFTAADDQPASRVAFKGPGEDGFGEPITFDHGDPLGRVDIQMLDEQTALVTWIESAEEQEDGKANIYVRTVSANGELGETVLIHETTNDRQSGFPRIGSPADGEVIAVWPDPVDEQVRSARITL